MRGLPLPPLVHRLVPCALLALMPAAALATSSIMADGFETGDLEAWSPDELQLRALIAGAPPDASQVDAVLETIGNSYGLPVRTAAGTFLFAADCGDESWDLAGDLNAWQPEVMSRSGALCHLEIAIQDPVESQYKFVDATMTFFGDPRARRYGYNDFGETSFVRASLAHLERRFGFGPQEGLAPRQLRIWVPANREFDRILYLQDGQNLFDPSAPFGGWNLQASLPDGVLAVGIDNTADRLAEYTHVADDFGGGPVGGLGDSYADLVHGTIRPFVESRYGASATHGLLGSSLGGLISLHIAGRFPGQYAFAASMSGSLGWGSFGAGVQNETIIERYAAAGHGPTAIYLDSGGGGTCVDSDLDGIEDDGSFTDNYCTTLQMRDVLMSEGYQLGTDLWYVWENGAAGNEQAWAARVTTPLAFFAGL